MYLAKKSAVFLYIQNKNTIYFNPYSIYLYCICERFSFFYKFYNKLNKLAKI